MLNNASGFRKVYIAAGYTDLRRGIDGLASIVKFNFQLDPYEKDILFLFCGRRSDRIKGLIWEGDGFLLLYKRLELGGFSWPRTKEEALEITPEQYRALMQGLEIVSRHPIQEVQPSDECKTNIKEVFDMFLDVDNGFNKTQIPLKSIFTDGFPVSRSQAKRLSIRFDDFEEVILDFNGIDDIGQGFAHELFVVFKRKHPDVKLITVNANDDVKRMISHVTVN